MKITKAVELFFKFVDLHGDFVLKSNSDLDIFEDEFKSFVKSLKYKNYDEISFKLSLAISQGFIDADEEAETASEMFRPSKLLSEYVIEQEKGFSKFLYGLFGSGIAVLGGLIGALITALV